MRLTITRKSSKSRLVQATQAVHNCHLTVSRSLLLDESGHRSYLFLQGLKCFCFGKFYFARAVTTPKMQLETNSPALPSFQGWPFRGHISEVTRKRVMTLSGRSCTGTARLPDSPAPVELQTLMTSRKGGSVEEASWWHMLSAHQETFTSTLLVIERYNLKLVYEDFLEVDEICDPSTKPL